MNGAEPTSAIEARRTRRIGAATAIPRAIAGSNAPSRLLNGWCVIDTYPDVGSMCSFSPKITIRMIPVRNTGSAVPTAVKAETSPSNQRFRQIAATVAVGTAIRSPISIARIASSSVAPTRCATSVVTGNWLKYDLPRLP